MPFSGVSAGANGWTDSVGRNNIGEEGVAALGAMLRVNTTLQTLEYVLGVRRAV